MSKEVVVADACLKLQMKIGPDIEDITDRLNQIIEDVRIRMGVLNATIVGSTGSLTTIEFEPGVIKDLKDAILRLAPKDYPYEHEKAWNDGNGHSHVQAALLGPSLSLPVKDNRLLLGRWQQAVAINLDNRSRERHIQVTLTGCE